MLLVLCFYQFIGKLFIEKAVILLTCISKYCANVVDWHRKQSKKLSFFHFIAIS